MRSLRPRSLHAVLTLLLLLTPALAFATDVDGPDCQASGADWGDAPEGVEAYPGVIGAFPTCFATGPASTLEFASGCTIYGTQPSAGAGYVRHVYTGDGNYWLGCATLQGAPAGVDNDGNGKVSVLPGTNQCGGGQTDSIESAWLSWGQDESYGSDDAGVGSIPLLEACETGNVGIEVYNCGPPRQVTVNVLVDYNRDGDWNDTFQCPSGACAPEWAVFEHPLTIGSGCNFYALPGFVVGPNPGQAWMRVTIADNAAPSDFPWNGSASRPQGAMVNGETEDYPVQILTSPVATESPTWGSVKARFED